LVGGVVRDIISGASIRDLDFAVQGNALKLVKDWKSGAVIERYREIYAPLCSAARNLPPARCQRSLGSHDKPGNLRRCHCEINEDVRRRDFTCNAMALSLNPGSADFCLIRSTEWRHRAKLIRILHNYAFLEEPSRMIRATRFAPALTGNLKSARRSATTQPKKKLH